MCALELCSRVCAAVCEYIFSDKHRLLRDCVGLIVVNKYSGLVNEVKPITHYVCAAYVNGCNRQFTRTYAIYVTIGSGLCDLVNNTTIAIFIHFHLEKETNANINIPSTPTQRFVSWSNGGLRSTQAHLH